MSVSEGGWKGERRGLLGWFGELDRLLTGEYTGVSLLRERGLGISPWRLSACIVILGMSYGICMGLFSVFGEKGPGAMQVVASMVKVPLVFYLTLIVTLPSLYVFNALVGSRISFVGVVRLLVASLGVNVTVLASLGPIVAFFSVCTTSYPFMKLLNVAVFAVAGAFGLRFLFQTLHRMNLAAGPWPTAEAGDEAGPLQPVPDRSVASHVRLVFRLWMIVFGLVGAQMGWILRPFIGDPSLPFAWFRHRESNFFLAVLQALQNLFS